MTQPTTGSSNQFTNRWHAVVGQTCIVQYKNDLNETNWNFATQINTRTTNVIEIVPADAQVFSPSDGIDNFDPGPDRTINFQFQ